MISVLIANYNNGHFFKDCYDSLISQTFKEFEVIILDDCSIDDSYLTIQKIIANDTRFKLYKNETNKQVGYTKKKLVELANFEICGFLDPDDALTEDAIEISVKAHENKCVAAYSQLYFCDENLNPKKVFENTKKVKNNDALFFNIQFEVAHFFTFKKESYLKTEGINPDYKVAEDIDYILKLYEIGNFYFIEKPLYYYRIHKKGLSHDQAKVELKNQTWNIVIQQALVRRGIKKIYGKNASEIKNIQHFIFSKQNTFFKKLMRKIPW
jgi:glycosyltransferase involved in cell wall biosynthesis